MEGRLIDARRPLARDRQLWHEREAVAPASRTPFVRLVAALVGALALFLLAMPALAEQIHGVGVGHTVLLKQRTQTSKCTLSPDPDRQCSPGAYYSALTKKRICAAGFRTDPIRDVPDSEKKAVEVEYGLAPKKYGRTLEIDHIVSLELGGSNDNRQPLPREAGCKSGLQGEGQAGKQAARPRVRREAQAAERSPAHRLQLADAVQGRLRGGAERLVANGDKSGGEPSSMLTTLRRHEPDVVATAFIRVDLGREPGGAVMEDYASLHRQPLEVADLTPIRELEVDANEHVPFLTTSCPFERS